MALIILGLVLWIAGMVIIKQKEELHKLGSGLRIVGLLFVVIGFLTSCIKQIDAGQVGVKSLFGKIDDDVLTSGLSIVNPLVDVKSIDIKTQNYTMSGVHDEGEKGGDDAIRVLTADGLEVVLDLTALYRVIGADAPRL
ncbi:MAG: SPFH domain-containing protein, partial [Sediminibacterium sp.]